MGDAEGDVRVAITDPDDTIDAGTGRRSEAPRAIAISQDYPELTQIERRHYVIKREIAKGGMGRVLEARDLRLGRDVAIKELLPKNRDAARRFEREARITARLQHPGIIHVYEAGTWPGGEPFYAMPIVAGRSLDKVVAERTTLEERLALVPVLIAVADALAYAHSERVIHRDLKPANVLVGEFGQTVVIDWGLAKDLAAITDAKESMAMQVRESAELEATVSGSVVGTPAYMPPEQARGDIVDQRADVYAIGALLYKLLCGKAPFEGQNAAAILEKVKAGPPPLIATAARGTPRELIAITEKAMARDAAQRYESAAELAQDLKRFETGQLVAAHEYTRSQLVLRWLKRHRIAVTVAVIVVAGGAYSVMRVVDAKRVAEAGRRALLEEQGRTQLVVQHHAGAALAYLVGAARGGEQDAALRFLLADARRPFDAQVARLDAGVGAVTVAVSRDGRYIATGANVVKLWTQDGKLVRELGRFGRVRALAFDPKGTRLVAAGDDGIARIWPVDGGSAIELKAKGAIDDLDWSADGRWVATGHDDGTARVWDVASASQYAEIRCHVGAITSLRFSPDGASLVTASYDNTACVWRSSVDELVPLRGHTKPVSSARWSHDGRFVITASDDGSARVWDVEANGKLAVEPLFHDRGSVTIAELSSDDAFALTAGDDHVARLWKLPDVIPSPLPESFQPRAPRIVSRMFGHTDVITTAAFGNDDALIATGGFDNSVKLWDAATGQEIAWFEHADIVHSLAFTSSRLVSGSRDGSARLWTLPNTTGSRDLESPVSSISVSPTGWIAAGTADTRVTLWRGETSKVFADHRGRVFAVAFTPDGKRLVSGGEDPYLFVWDPETGRRVGQLGEASGPIRSIAIDHGIVAAVAAGEVHRWKLDNTPVGTLRAKGAVVEVIAFSPDGRWLVGGSSDGSLVVWNTSSGEVAFRRNEQGPITALAFTADGAIVVAGQGSLRLYAVSDRGELAAEATSTIEGPTGEVRSMAVTHGGELVIIASDDGIARVWDVRRGKLLGTRGAHRKGLSSLAVAGDDQLWLGSLDGTVSRWDITAEPRPIEPLLEGVPWRLDENDVVVRTNEGDSDGKRRTNRE